jgi:polar amino acid transport system substrate-binding protein
MLVARGAAAGQLMVRLLLVCLLAFGGGAGALAQQAAEEPPPTQTLRIATGFAAPFVLNQGDTLTGFSIELWTALAHRLHVATRFVDLGLRSDHAQIEAVRKGDADVAIAAITITAVREREVDFSMPYFDSGLQIAVPANGVGNPVLGTFEAFLSREILQLFGLGFVVILLLAHLLWLVERRHNPHFQRGYLPGVLEGLWGVMLIIATGEHGDRDAPGWLKRLTVAFLWLFGVVLVAQFTATVTSSLTVRTLRSTIDGPNDLPGKTIATYPDSIAAEYLTERGLSFLPVTNAKQGAAMLASGQVQAIVFEAPTLQYWIATEGANALELVGPVFLPEKYGIAVAIGSPLRKRINEALLEMQADGSFASLRTRWFGQER